MRFWNTVYMCKHLLTTMRFFCQPPAICFLRRSERHRSITHNLLEDLEPTWLTWAKATGPAIFVFSYCLVPQIPAKRNGPVPATHAKTKLLSQILVPQTLQMLFLLVAFQESHKWRRKSPRPERRQWWKWRPQETLWFDGIIPWTSTILSRWRAISLWGRNKSTNHTQHACIFCKVHVIFV